MNKFHFEKKITAHGPGDAVHQELDSVFDFSRSIITVNPIIINCSLKRNNIYSMKISQKMIISNLKTKALELDGLQWRIRQTRFAMNDLA